MLWPPFVTVEGVWGIRAQGPMASAIRKALIGSRLRPPPNAPVLLEEEATDLKGDIVTQGLKIINTAMPCHLNLHLVLFVITPCLASVLHRSIIRSDYLIFVPCFAFPPAQAAFTRALCLRLLLALCLSLPLPLPDSSTVRVFGTHAAVASVRTLRKRATTCQECSW